MFGKRRIVELEQKVAELSRLNKITWEVVGDYGDGSPPHIFSRKYEANQQDVLKALLEHLKLEAEKKPATEIGVKIVKAKINK